MFCIKCGKQLPEDAAFCFACGAKVWNGEETSPAVNTSSVYASADIADENDVLSVSSEAKVQFGNFFVESDGIYFIMHGYELGTHTQLWKSDLDGKNQKCLFDFDTTPYTVYYDLFMDDDAYPMAKIDRLIVFTIDDENKTCNYYYHIDSGKHGIMKDCRLPDRKSEDGKYFFKDTRNYNTGELEITLLTPQEALRGENGREIILNASKLYTLYSRFEGAQLQCSEYYVYNENQLLIPIVVDGEYLWTRINLFNLSDYAVLTPGHYLLPCSNTLITDGASILFNDGRRDAVVCVDAASMTVKSGVKLAYADMSSYGSLTYISAPYDENACVFDFKTSAFRAVTGNVNVFEHTKKLDICITAAGAYKYSHQSGETRIYFIPASEMFKPCSTYYDDGECVQPIVALDYQKEFKPVVRNAATDENVYSYDNTKELGYVVFDYAEKMSSGNNDAIFLSFFYLSRCVTLPDGKRIGFVYGHKPEYQDSKNYYYNLYEVDINGNYRFLGCGSRGGIEELKIYKNYAYWPDMGVCRYDFETGEFLETHYDFATGEYLESHKDWLREEYDAVCKKQSKRQF